VPGSLLEKHCLNILTETLIIVYERSCDGLFWLIINGDAIREKVDSRVTENVADSVPAIVGRPVGGLPIISRAMSIKHLGVVRTHIMPVH
jgi:hypothetical protein